MAKIKTNYMYHLENFFGKEKIDSIMIRLTSIIKSVESNFYRNNFVTNPLLKTFYSSCIINGSKVEYDLRRIIPNSNWIYFKFIAHLINYLTPEISRNSDFKVDIKKRLLNPRIGTYYPAFSELLVGSYLKFCNCKITFNSSAQVGQPDIIVTKPIKFANESKIFPDSEYELLDKIITNKTSIMSLLKQVNNQEVIVFVLNFNNFNKELSQLGSQYVIGNKSQNGKSLMFMKNTMYIGNQGYVVDHPKNKCQIRFIPNFKLTNELIGKNLSKAEVQFRNAGMKGLLWLGFPNQKEVNMIRYIIWHVTQFPKEFKKKNLGLVLYDWMPEIRKLTLGISSALQIATDSQDLDFISNKSFSEYIDKILSIPTLLVPN